MLVFATSPLKPYKMKLFNHIVVNNFVLQFEASNSVEHFITFFKDLHVSATVSWSSFFF